MYKQNWFDRLQWKYGRYAINNLMSYIVFTMGIVYILDMFIYPISGFSLSRFLAFDRTAVMHGQIWRLFTFIFIPPNSSLLFILFSLYFYWLVGNALESVWGAFKFNIFYLVGILGTIIAGFITGYGTNSYLNMTLFLAFAMIYPDYELLVFFFLPLKVKWLAMIDAVSMLMMFLRDTWSGKLAMLVALINLAIFFGGDMLERIHDYKRRRDFRRNFNDF